MCTCISTYDMHTRISTYDIHTKKNISSNKNNLGLKNPLIKLFCLHFRYKNRN